ncbi:hypothetical protein KEM48_005956 [Puccinia striiformis f. sp. tritici PST-130]|nr:hypothetical protein KEM48_005956 [Puccinia striiformis f. sp. tritici PST-130]
MYLLEANNPVPQLLSTTRESHSSARGIIIAMLQFFRLIALVSLIASCEVTSEDITVTPFGCHRNVDALVPSPWMVANKRSRGPKDCMRGPGLPMYWGRKPECCQQGQFKEISSRPNKSMQVKLQDTSDCHHGGQ